jgi:hypothetical protein
MRIRYSHHEPPVALQEQLLLETIARSAKTLLGGMGNLRQDMQGLLSPEGEARARGEEPEDKQGGGLGPGKTAGQFSRALVTMILAQTQQGLHNPQPGDLYIRGQRLYYHKDPRNLSRLTFARDQHHWVAFDVLGIGQFAPTLKEDYEIKLLGTPSLDPTMSPNVAWVRIESMSTIRSAL